MTTVKTSVPNNTLEITSFLNLAFKDYIAARILILNNQLLQGAVQASTSIEKYFKTIDRMKGNKTGGHLKNALLNQVKNYDRKLFDSFNKSFLEFLIKVYELRYFDTVPVGFSVNIHSNQLLAEIDYTVSEIQKRFVLKAGERVFETLYDTSLREKDPNLFRENFLLQGLEKKEFVEGKATMYGILVTKDKSILEVSYVPDKFSDDGDFLKPGITEGKQAGH